MGKIGQWAEKEKKQQHPPKKQKQNKQKNRKSSRGRQKNKTGDSEVESNDGPEIPAEEGGGHQTSAAFLRGLGRENKQTNKKTH